MIQRLKLVAFAAIIALMGVLALQPSASALDPSKAINKGVDSAGGSNTDATQLNTNLEDVVNILLFVLGAIAVIMIVVGGIRYALSAGDQSAITAAKNTILYSVIGLVVAILAYAIVKWVINAF